VSAIAAFVRVPEGVSAGQGPLANLLDGVAVVDLTRNLPGPYCTRLLADMGASVVKIEPPAGDPVRAVGLGRRSATADGREGGWYDFLNHGKRVVTLDLRDSTARPELDRLLADADVCVEGFKPETARQIGVDAATLAARYPQLVHCSISGFGQSSPDANRAAHDLNYQAMAGLLRSPREVDGAGQRTRPEVPRMLLADITGALHAVIGIVSALVARGRTNQGAAIDVSLFDAAKSWLPFLDPPRINGAYACYHVYETADGQWVALGALEPKFWARFCTHVGHADWIPIQFAGDPARNEVIAAATNLFRSRTFAEWDRELTPLDCCFSAVRMT
jgi:alpha-methylacyl-CoA racemase